ARRARSSVQRQRLARQGDDGHEHVDLAVPAVVFDARPAAIAPARLLQLFEHGHDLLVHRGGFLAQAHAHVRTPLELAAAQAEGLRLVSLAQLDAGAVGAGGGVEDAVELPAAPRPDEALELLPRLANLLGLVGHLQEHHRRLGAFGPYDRLHDDTPQERAVAADQYIDDAATSQRANVGASQLIPR